MSTISDDTITMLVHCIMLITLQCEAFHKSELHMGDLNICDGNYFSTVDAQNGNRIIKRCPKYVHTCIIFSVFLFAKRL